VQLKYILMLFRNIEFGTETDDKYAYKLHMKYCS